MSEDCDKPTEYGPPVIVVPADMRGIQEINGSFYVMIDLAEMGFTSRDQIIAIAE